VPGTVDLLEAPPLNPEELLLAGLDEPVVGGVEVDELDGPAVLGCGGLLLVPPLKPDEEDGSGCVELFVDGLDGFVLGVVENDPDLEDVEGAEVEDEGVELLRLGVLDVLLLPEIVAAYDVMGLRESTRATDITISFLFIFSSFVRKLLYI
jgi:hypothetical protein